MCRTSLWRMTCACGISLASASLLLAAEREPKPILWFDFAGRTDEVCADRSGNGNDGRLYGPRRAHTPLGAGLKFDGIDDFVALPDIGFHAFKGLTVEVWVKPRGGSLQPILGFGVDTVHLNCNGGKAAFIVRNAASRRPTAEAPAVLAPGKFHHVVGTYDGRRVCVYVDGKLEASVELSGAVRDDRSIGARLGSSLGWPTQTWDHYFRGQMAEVKIYDVALSPRQVKAACEAARFAGKRAK